MAVKERICGGVTSKAIKKCNGKLRAAYKKERDSGGPFSIAIS